MFVSRSRDMSFPRLALAGALAVALGLAACGRKGPLEPPPGAAIEAPPAVAEVPPPGTTWAQPPPLAADSSPRVPGRPYEGVTASAPAAKQPSILDWLIR
jgi:predicted small lipoprotein YifL